MKIIRKGKVESKYVYRFSCSNCESIFELEEDELPDKWVHKYGVYHYQCPVCEKLSWWICEEVRYDEDN